MTTLPVYLRKKILFFLCDYINFSLEYTDSNQTREELLQKRVNKLSLSLALVCKEWFDIIQHNISVSEGFQYKYNYVDYNYPLSKYLFKEINNNNTENNNNKINYSIIKSENIKILKITYNSLTGSVHCKEKTIYPDVIGREIIKSLPNLEKLIIKSISGLFMQWSNLFFINQLKINKLLNINNSNNNIDNSNNNINNNNNKIEIIIHNNEITSNTKNENINSLNSKTNNVLSLTIRPRSEESVVVHSIKVWFHSLKGLKLDEDTQFPFRELSGFNQDDYETNQLNLEYHQYLPRKQSEHYQSEGINYLRKIEEYILPFSYTSIQDIYYSLNSSTNIKSFEISICFDQLVYFLSNNSERKSLWLKSCHCNSLIHCERIGDSNISQSIFNHYWSSICSLLTEKNQLKNLTISNSNKCCYNRNLFSQSFLESFSLMVSNIQNLENLIIYNCIDPILSECILKYNYNNPLNIIFELNQSALQNYEKTIEQVKLIISNNKNKINSFRLWAFQLFQNPETLLSFSNNEFSFIKKKPDHQPINSVFLSPTNATTSFLNSLRLISAAKSENVDNSTTNQSNNTKQNKKKNFFKKFF
ncbi:hypothetical protein DICPUDRAFT_82967 [Dictyostelium purpureum]|uniref:F-box domain-containing protein n=1 Tax=Dictyostelium purpureum TaxID=5786 RepID=F0ZY56_DICPU|nr:uncharacterized protein DICPUDRAFT_82967 [Dictyostelium purpureum]EGC31135.1 hypothetical protein DICPUDRAFT_82967 [Dictyostelium purpureum]|eukprot:XP_003292353.1 hypothetical protein DICPUDRAFT_82967 [Dictyostelium purpureum]